MSQDNSWSGRSSSERINLPVVRSCLSEDLNFVTAASSYFASAVSTLENENSTSFKPKNKPTKSASLPEIPVLESQTVLRAELETSNVLSETSLAAKYATSNAQPANLLTIQTNSLTGQSATVLPTPIKTSNVISERSLATLFETLLTLSSGKQLSDQTDPPSSVQSNTTTVQHETFLNDESNQSQSSQSPSTLQPKTFTSLPQSLQTEDSNMSTVLLKAPLTGQSDKKITSETINSTSEKSTILESKSSQPETLTRDLMASQENISEPQFSKQSNTMTVDTELLLAAKFTISPEESNPTLASDVEAVNPTMSDMSADVMTVASTDQTKSLLTDDTTTSKTSLPVMSKPLSLESTTAAQSKTSQPSCSKTSTAEPKTLTTPSKSVTTVSEIPLTTECSMSQTLLRRAKSKSSTASLSKKLQHVQDKPPVTKQLKSQSDMSKSKTLFDVHPGFETQLTRRKIAMLMAVFGFLSCIVTFIIALCIPEDPKMAALRAEQEYFELEVDLPIFRGAIRLEQIKEKAVVWNEAMRNLDSNETNIIKKAVLPVLQSSFEAEGFHISSVQAVALKPYIVTVYDVMNHTVTSLSYNPSASRNSIGSDKSTEFQNLGLRNTVRLLFQCTATPSENAAVLSVVGANEIGVVQFMLSNYLASQRIIATLEPVEVPNEFRNAVKLARSAVPRLGRISQEEQTQTGEYIACHKSGHQMSSSHQLVTCPSDCNEIMQRQVFGTLWYHEDSPVCLAAIHTSVIKASEGGTFEYIRSGFGLKFTGSFQYGVNSSNLDQYGGKFMVKRTGPSWKVSRAAEPTNEPKTTTEGIQEAVNPLFIISFTLLKYGDTVTDYSSLHLGNPVLAARIKNTLKIKTRRALHNLHFDPRSIEVVFQLSLSTTRSMFVKIKIYGGYNANAQGFFPYKPWQGNQNKKLLSDILKIFKTSNIKLKSSNLGMDQSLLSALEVMPSTTIAPTPYTGTCSCGEVFFIQSLDPSLTSKDITKIISMYQNIFEAFDFDQSKLGLGFGFLSSSSLNNAKQISNSWDQRISASGEIVTRIGQDLSTGTLRRINEILEGFQADEVDVSEEKLWKMLQKLERETSFMQENLGKRKKLLVISSRFVFGPDAGINLEYLNRVKEKGIHVAYVGYNWDNDLLKSYYYPQQYASTPPTNFVKYVGDIDQLDKVAAFLNQVISKYICNKPPRSCAALSFNVPPPADLTYNMTFVHEKDFTGSYANGIPTGTGLKAFKVHKSIHYNGVKLAETSSIRKTEPDQRQAFYMGQQCGVPANQPSLQVGKIVGGSEAIPHTWPWSISINKLTGSRDYYTNKMKYTKNFWKCGGSIVHKRWILTAAHCFAKGNEQIQSTKYQVVVGRHDQNKLATIPGDEYRIVKIAYHPKYDDPRNQYDIALLKLHRDIPFRREVSPVCLPNPDVIPRNDRRCWVVGWGFTSNTAKTPRNKLKQAVQYMETPNKCQYIYRRYYYNPNNNICAKRSTVKGNVNIQCRAVPACLDYLARPQYAPNYTELGDSGGPLVCEENGRWVQYGVSNFGPRLCELGGEGAYFLVASVLDWMCCYLDKNVGPCAYVKCAYGTS